MSRALEWRRVGTLGHSLDNRVWSIIKYYFGSWDRCFLSAYLQADSQHVVNIHHVILHDPNPSGISVFLSICSFLYHTWPICSRAWLRPSWSFKSSNSGSLLPAKVVTLTFNAWEDSVRRLHCPIFQHSKSPCHQLMTCPFLPEEENHSQLNFVS